MGKTLKTLAIVSLLTSSLSLVACETAHSKTMPEREVVGYYEPDHDNDDARPSLIIEEGNLPEVIYTGRSRDRVLTSDVYKTVDVQTLVGRKVVELSQDLNDLKDSIDAKSAYLHRLRTQGESTAKLYYDKVGNMSARLQSGTTPGNPDLVEDWNISQDYLNQLAESSGELNNFANDMSADASRAAFLLESIRATFTLSGAREEDHARLVEVEDDVNQVIVRIDRLLNQANDETNRRTTYLRTERLNMQTLSHAIANGELYGQNITNRLFKRAAQPAMGKAEVGPLSTNASGMVTGRRPLVVIRFDRSDLEYEQALFGALSQALERRPDAQFDLVAVNPSQGNAAEVALYSTAARKNGEAVLRSITQMGVPLERVTLNSASSSTVRNSEVHLYIR